MERLDFWPPKIINRKIRFKSVIQKCEQYKAKTPNPSSAASATEVDGQLSVLYKSKCYKSTFCALCVCLFGVHGVFKASQGHSAHEEQTNHGIAFLYHAYEFNGAIQTLCYSSMFHCLSSPMAQCVARRAPYAAVRMVAGSRPVLVIA